MSAIPKDIIVTENHYNNLVHERDAFKAEVERLKLERDQYKSQWGSVLDELRQANNEIERLNVELAKTNRILEDILHKATNARMWNGQGWTWHGEVHMERIYNVALAAVKAGKEENELENEKQLMD
jgi:hypothetical protein